MYVKKYYTDFESFIPLLKYWFFWILMMNICACGNSIYYLKRLTNIEILLVES